MQRDTQSRHVEYWRAWAKHHDVAFVDCFPDFIDARSPEAVIRQHFITGDVHWNAAGSAVVARRLLSSLHPKDW